MFCRQRPGTSNRGNPGLVAGFAVAFLIFGAATVKSEDGYRLWLRYESVPARMIKVYRQRVTALVVSGNSATFDAIRSELSNGCKGLLGNPIPVVSDVTQDGAVVVGTPETSPLFAGLRWEAELAKLGPEGFRIRSVELGAHSVTVIASESEIGALYGVFHFLRLMQTLQPINSLDVTQKPRVQLRMLNHWDNLDGRYWLTVLLPEAVRSNHTTCASAR